MDGVSFWGDENAVKSTVVPVAFICEYTKIYWTVQCNGWTVCKWYLNKDPFKKALFWFGKQKLLTPNTKQKNVHKINIMFISYTVKYNTNNNLRTQNNL